MSVRLANIDDCEAVVALWQDAGLTRPWNDPRADFKLAVNQPLSAILLETNDNSVVGSVMVGFDGHRGWVYYLATSVEHRGEGLGRKLMKEAENWLRARGCPKIQLMVRRDNSEALGFYEAIGYELQDVVTMGRRLD